MKISLCWLWLAVIVTCESVRYPKGFNKYVVVKLVRVVSGDMIVFTHANDTRTQYIEAKLSQIESPQLNESYGKAAKEHLEKLLRKAGNKTVRLLIATKQENNGVLYARLYVGRRDINLRMVLNGFARCYKKTQCPYKYRAAMKVAKWRRLGIWKRKNDSRAANMRFPSRKKYERGKGSSRRSIDVILNRVVDGDTIYVTQSNTTDKSIIKVRMKGIDSPEMKQPYGPEAKNHLQTLISNLQKNGLRLIVVGRDKYKRTLATVWCGNVDINKEMVEDGYAWCYRHTDCPKLYLEAMKKAQRGRKGLFVQDKPVAPWDWRKQQKQ